MATTTAPITKDVLQEEVNTRFWAWTAHKIGKRLDPNIPSDKAMTKVWLAILDDVRKQAEAGTLVITHYQPEVIEALADAQVASDQALAYLEAAAAASDPQIRDQQAAAAAAAVRTAVAKAREARAGQTLNLPPEIMQEVAREANASALPASASPADRIAHVQVQNTLASAAAQNGQNGQNGQPQAAPSQEALYQETNHRFWRQYNYKPGQKLDMTDFQDQMMAEAWKVIYGDVQREAAEGRLVMTPPPFGVPQDPYADPQPSQDFSQPQYGAYGAPPGLTPPQNGGQPSFPPQGFPQQGFPQQGFPPQDFSQPQYGAYGAPPGLTPPQNGMPQVFPQTPQYMVPEQMQPQYASAAQEMPVPQYGAAQQVTPPQYEAPQDFAQYGSPQDFAQNGVPQGYPTMPQPAPQAPQMQTPGAADPYAAQQAPQAIAPQQPQMQVPPGMEGYPADLWQQYAQQQQQQPAPQAPQTPPPPTPAPQTPPTPRVPEDMRRAPTPSRTQAAPSPRASASSSPRASQALPSASAALTTKSTATAQTKEDMSMWGKIGLAFLAVGGISAVVYAAKRSSHATIRGSSSHEAPPYLAHLYSRGGRY